MCLETGQRVPLLHEILLVLEDLSVVAHRITAVDGRQRDRVFFAADQDHPLGSDFALMAGKLSGRLHGPVDAPAASECGHSSQQQRVRVHETL